MFAEFFLNKDWAMTALFVGIFGVPASVGVACYFWYQVRRIDAITELKHELLTRGMSAEQIKMVVEAGLRSPESIDEVKRDMLDRGMTPENIDRVLKAGQQS
jgi:hypothetical protein